MSSPTPPQEEKRQDDRAARVQQSQDPDGLSNLSDRLRELLNFFQQGMRSKYYRRVPIGDLLTDRWEIARDCGFGEGTSCYDNVLIIGYVKVGSHCWIGPNVVLDGSGGLTIGDYCDISAGCQIYSHHTVARVLSAHTAPIEQAPVRIGDRVYVGPNTVIQKGVTIGDGVVIGAMSLVRRDIPSGVRAWGVPAKVIGANPPEPSSH